MAIDLQKRIKVKDVDSNNVVISTENVNNINENQVNSNLIINSQQTVISNQYSLSKVFFDISYYDKLTAIDWLVGEQPIHADIGAILCGDSGKMEGNDIRESCIFFNNVSHSSGAFKFAKTVNGKTGLNVKIDIDLDKVPMNIKRIVCVAYLYDGVVREQTFSSGTKMELRVVDIIKMQAIKFVNFKQYQNSYTGYLFSKFYRDNGGWNHRNLDVGFDNISRLNHILEKFI